MKKSTKVAKQIQKCLFITFMVMMVSTSAVYAQNESGREMSENDGMYQVKNDLSDLNSQTSIKDEKSQKILPEVGSNLNKMAKRVFNLLVEDESSTVNIVISDSQNLQNLALTSSFINDQLLGGMKLEFHANPMEGRGALMFKKMF